MQMIIVVGIVVGSQELVEERFRSETAGQGIEKRRAWVTPDVLFEVALDGERFSRCVEVVQIDGEPVGVVAEAPRSRGSIDVGPRKADATHTVLAHEWPDPFKGQR